MGEAERMFPIMKGPAVPWSLIAPYGAQAQKNHYQTLKRLAERGGLSISEAMAVMSEVPFEKRPIAKPSVEDWLDFIAKRKARAERRSALAGLSRTVTLSSEAILGGLRFDAGTYEIRRVEPVATGDPAF